MPLRPKSSSGEAASKPESSYMPTGGDGALPSGAGGNKDKLPAVGEEGFGDRKASPQIPGAPRPLLQAPVCSDGKRLRTAFRNKEADRGRLGISVESGQ